MAADAPGYFLSVSDAVRERMLSLNHRAREAEMLPEWIATMRTALERISARPEEAGDPLLRMRHLNLTIYRLLLNRVCVFYALHDWERIVIIKSVIPVLGHPLEGLE